MKKCICFMLLVFLCFNFIFITNSLAYDGVQNQETRVDKKTIKNIAVFVRFSDNNETHHIDDDVCVINAEKILNNKDSFEMNTKNGVINVPSFKKFYEMQSYGKLSIETEIFPRVNGKVTSYKDPNPIGYYLKKNNENPNGYANLDEALAREKELISGAVRAVAEQIRNEGIDPDELDTSGNGKIDAITFFIEGQKKLTSAITWGDLLWSHQSSNKGITETILGKEIGAYSLVYVNDYTESVGVFSLNRGTYGTIIHEFGHMLGYKDLYRYNASQNNPVGFYDIMGNYAASNPPDLLTYFITDYNTETNWHRPLPVISKTTNNITLVRPEYIDENEKRAVKVQQYPGSNEYFIIEYHEKKNTYETHCADKSGIIVYRVNDKNKYNGNSRWR